MKKIAQNIAQHRFLSTLGTTKLSKGMYVVEEFGRVFAKTAQRKFAQSGHPAAETVWPEMFDREQ
jgi:hypothetical protein